MFYSLPVRLASLIAQSKARRLSCKQCIHVPPETFAILKCFTLIDGSIIGGAQAARNSLLVVLEALLRTREECANIGSSVFESYKIVLNGYQDSSPLRHLPSLRHALVVSYSNRVPQAKVYWLGELPYVLLRVHLPMRAEVEACA